MVRVRTHYFYPPVLVGLGGQPTEKKCYCVYLRVSCYIMRPIQNIKMKNNLIIQLEELHRKSLDLFHKFETLSDRDIKRNHILLMSSQIATSLISLKVCFRYSEINKEEFEKLFKGDHTQIENYIHVFKQCIIEAILDTALFQTELVLRVLYSKLTGENPAQEGNIQKIIATLFEDIQNNWQKEEAKLFVLFWTMRNTIHTGGIYYKNPKGYSITYKGNEYKFEFMKSIGFLAKVNITDLLNDFLDSLDYLFSSKKIINLGDIDHPSYHALGYV